MISYLKGKIFKKSDKFIVILVGNVGFKVFLSKKALFGLNSGEERRGVYMYTGPPR